MLRVRILKHCHCITIKSLQHPVKPAVVQHEHLHSSCQTKCLGTRFRESQGGSGSQVGDISSRRSVWVCQVHSRTKTSVHADPGHCALRLIRCFLIALIRRLLPTEGKCFCPLERRAGWAVEKTQGSTKADQRHLTSPWWESCSLTDQAQRLSLLTRPLCKAHRTAMAQICKTSCGTSAGRITMKEFLYNHTETCLGFKQHSLKVLIIWDSANYRLYSIF